MDGMALSADMDHRHLGLTGGAGGDDFGGEQPVDEACPALQDGGLADGVAELAVEEEHRRFARVVDPVQVGLDQGCPAGVEDRAQVGHGSSVLLGGQDATCPWSRLRRMV